MEVAWHYRMRWLWRPKASAAALQRAVAG